MTVAHGGTRPSVRILSAARSVPTAVPTRIRILPQIAILLAAVAAYFLVRGFTEAAYGDALRNARHVVRLERWLGLYREPALQEALVGSQAVRGILNSVYIWGHWPVIAVTLLWLARRRPELYLRTRDSMLVSGAVGLVVFAWFPVAPPRLADLGMADTVSAASGAYRMMQPKIFTNQYAAMPSLHVGWNLLISLAIVAAVRHLVARVAATAMALAMATAVVLTANHYLVDALVGAAITTTCWILVGRWHERRSHRPDESPLRLPRTGQLRLPRAGQLRFRRGRAEHEVSPDSRRVVTGQPLLPRDRVLDLAQFAAGDRLLPLHAERSHVPQADRCHRGAGGGVDRHRLPEDAT